MKIIINETAEITAEGNLTNKNCKPVICLNNGIIFASGKDAAEFANASPGHVCECLQGRIKSCKGFRFVYLSKVNENLDDIMTRYRELVTMEDDAKKWREQQQREETRQAEAKRLADAEKAAAAAQKEREELHKSYLAAVAREEVAKHTLSTLRGN